MSSYASALGAAKEGAMLAYGRAMKRLGGRASPAKVEAAKLAALKAYDEEFTRILSSRGFAAGTSFEAIANRKVTERQTNARPAEPSPQVAALIHPRSRVDLEEAS